MLAKQSDLYVFSDHPKDEAAKEAVGEVRQIISDIRGFSTVTVIKRDKNLGLAKSVISGVTEVINKEGRVIVLEDDLVTSPQFLEYMNQALRHYERDPKVFSIGGYQFPERTMKIPKGYPFDAYSGYRCCSWGWATWKDRWDRIDWEMKYFDAFMADAKSQAKFNLGGADRTQMLVHQREGKVNSWAIRFCYAHFQNDMRCIYPAKSLVNNIGLDNSGVHCGVDPSRQHDALDENFLPKLFCPAEPIVPEIAEAFYRVFSPKLGAKGIFSRGWGFLKKAYRKMALKYHPDKNPGIPKSAPYGTQDEDDFTRLDNAYKNFAVITAVNKVFQEYEENKKKM
ncbi:glycosyltransferase, partial [bacterium]|nr:glycosyltransferase [bacterium]